MRMRIIGLAMALMLVSVEGGYAATVFSGIGLGDEEWIPDGRGSGMGGAGIALLDGQNFSRLNPAVLGSFRRPALSVLFRAEERRAKDRFVENRLSEGDVGHVRLVLSRGKRMAFRVGIEPVTGVNFSFVQPEPDNVVPDTLSLKMRGGLQAISFGIGVRLSNDRLFLGGSLDAVVIGTIHETWTRVFANADTLFPSQDEILRGHRGVRWTVGAAYRAGKGFSVGAFLIPRANLTQTRRLKTPFGLEDRSSVNLHLPTSLGVGVAFEGEGGKWAAAADVTASLWGKVDPTRYRNAYGLAAGISYVTGQEDPLGRAKRIPLQLGGSRKILQYAGLPGSGGAVTETAMSLGMGLPFRGGWGRFDLSFEVGKRGDVQKNGAQEVFFRQTFSIVGWPR